MEAILSGQRPDPTHKEPRSTLSRFDAYRHEAPLQIPTILQEAFPSITEKEALGAASDHEKIQEKFPNCYGKPRVELRPGTSDDSKTDSSSLLRIGCVLSGGQAPGGHNVIAGIYDCINKLSVDSEMIGFLDGPNGIYSGRYIVIDDDRMNLYRNTGGFDMLGSGRHKIEKPEEFEASMKVYRV